MATEYFSSLNYTLANEDTIVEYELLPMNVDRVFSIAGSGARCLPLLAKNPKVLDIIDMSQEQIYLCELRYESMRQLSEAEWLFFMGYRGAIQKLKLEGDSRLELFEKLSLSDKTRSFWLERKNSWIGKGFILLGRWESHFQKLGKIFRDYLQCDFSSIFQAQNLQEQISIYEKEWPRVRWNSFMRILASEYVFNKFLYKGHFSGKEEHRTEQRPPYQFIIEEFDRIFRSQLVRKNYFMQILFLGEIRYEEGLPLEAHSECIQKVKKSTTKLNYHVGNLLELLPKNAYDFISLSDTISYIPDAAANEILQKLNPQTSRGSQMVIRSFMRKPKQINTENWSVLKEKEVWAHDVDGTGVYEFHIYQKH
ncbi:MAG: DUF3419 family protein [Bdellovibrionaceae bacterium]|nr:DUF3419 family protein [Pseudobdellovibrionaceae bacterium]